MGGRYGVNSEPVRAHAWDDVHPRPPPPNERGADTRMTGSIAWESRRLLAIRIRVSSLPTRYPLVICLLPLLLSTR